MLRDAPHDVPQEEPGSPPAIRREVVAIERTFYRQGLPSFAGRRALRSAALRALPLLASTVLLELLWFALADRAVVWKIVPAAVGAVVTYRLVRWVLARRFRHRVPRLTDALWLLAFVGAGPAMGSAFGLSLSAVLTFLVAQALVAAVVLAGALGGVVGATVEAVEDLTGSLAQSLPSLLRSLPFLTLFSLVIFLTSETWQVLGRMPLPHLAVLVTLFGVLGTVFLLSRLPGQVQDIERLGNAEGPPLEPSQRRNLAAVVAFRAVFQVACVVALMTLVFTVLGTLAISDGIYGQWEVDPGPSWRMSWFGYPTVVSASLLKVSVVLAVICGLSYSLSILTDPVYRRRPAGSGGPGHDGDVPPPTPVPGTARGRRLNALRAGRRRGRASVPVGPSG